MLRKTIIGGVLMLGVLVFGFVLLLRSCLAKYDERSAVGAPLVIEANGKTLVFAIVEYERTTSYSRNGGMIRKTVSSSYYVQTNDGNTGEKIQSKKVKGRSQIKNYPVEILGEANGKAWLFMGELMAFDPATLEKTASASIIETKNPSLKGRLPAERQYYKYDREEGILITATDGSQFVLNPATLIASAVTEQAEKDPVKARLKELEKQVAGFRTLSDSNYAWYHRLVRLYDEKKISVKTFQDSSGVYMKRRDLISKMEDSVRKLSQHVDDEVRAREEQKRLSETLHRRASYSEININTDSLHRTWYALVTEKTMEQQANYFEYRKTWGDIDRNGLYSAALSPQEPNDPYSRWNVSTEKKQLTGPLFLQGGFLLDMDKGTPIHLTDPDAFLIVHKDKIGNEGKIQLTRVGIDGKQGWTVATGLKEFASWTLRKNKLYIFGVDNNELSSDALNVLMIVDITNGTTAIHDYFKDKNRAGK